MGARQDFDHWHQVSWIVALQASAGHQLHVAMGQMKPVGLVLRSLGLSFWDGLVRFSGFSFCAGDRRFVPPVNMSFACNFNFHCKTILGFLNIFLLISPLFQFFSTPTLFEKENPGFYHKYWHALHILDLGVPQQHSPMSSSWLSSFSILVLQVISDWLMLCKTFFECPWLTLARLNEEKFVPTTMFPCFFLEKSLAIFPLFRFFIKLGHSDLKSK